MTLRYDEIGMRLRAFRLGAGLTVEETASKIGISRAAMYRFEKGEVVKIENLESLAQLFGVSLPTLLGVEIEYVSSAVTYFERLRQLEEHADRIVVLAGPISYLLASDEFVASLGELLRESVTDENGQSREQSLVDIEKIMATLSQRRQNYLARRPTIINIISALDIERLLRSGFVGRPFISGQDMQRRKQRAADEVEHFARQLEVGPMGVQIGVIPGAVPHTGFQMFRSKGRETLTLSPFRLGGQPNINLGIALITSTAEAVSLHDKLVQQMWESALKGSKAAAYLRQLVKSTHAESETAPPASV